LELPPIKVVNLGVDIGAHQFLFSTQISNKIFKKITNLIYLFDNKFYNNGRI